MRVYALSDIGSVRTLNEDSYYVPQSGEKFCCVADGMGGHQAGEVASALAVQVFAEKMRDVLPPPHDRLHRAVTAANAAIYEKARSQAEMSGMGTTITALLLENGEAHIAHVGDSRCYLLRGKSLMKVTTDHTLVEEMMLKGVLTVQEARNHPQRNLITRALGTDEQVEVDLLRIRLQKGDVFLLCSDGLTGPVSDREIAEILNSRMKRENKLQALVEKALDAGGHDNITVLIVTDEEENA